MPDAFPARHIPQIPEGGVRESCGYVTGLLLHRALGEPACPVCVAAHSQRVRDGEGQEISPVPPAPEPPAPLPSDADGWDVPPRSYNFPSIN